MIQLTDREIDELMERVWQRVAIKLTHADILMSIPYYPETLDKCKCGKNKPPKK